MLDPLRIAVAKLRSRSDGNLSCFHIGTSANSSACHMLTLGSLDIELSNWQLWPLPDVGDVSVSPSFVGKKLGFVPNPQIMNRHSNCSGHIKETLGRLKENQWTVQVTLNSSQEEHFNARAKELGLDP